MWKGLVFMTILLLFLFVGMKLLLDAHTDLILYDKTAINLMIVSGILICLLLVWITIIGVAEWVKDKLILNIFSELYVANWLFLALFSALSVIYYIAYADAMKPNIGRLLITVLAISAWVLVLASIVLWAYWWKRTPDPTTEEFKMVHPESPEGRRSLEKQYENTIRSLPTIIYQTYHDLKTQEWNICEEKFSHGESLKVFPKWYHIFHHEWIKEWYKKKQSWPIDSKYIIEGDIDKMENIEAEITKGTINN